MRFPGYEEGLLTAGLVLRVKRDEVEGMIRAERLHQAIMVPAAHVNGTPLYRSRAEQAKCLLVECALGRILPTPDDDFWFGWLMMQRAIELSHCTWRPPRGHQARLDAFRAELREGTDPGQELVTWLGEGIKPPYKPPADGEPRPIHVSSPMHPAPACDICEWADAVDEGLKGFLEQWEGGETAFTHRPQVYPIQDVSSSEGQRAIERRIHQADGLVILAPQSSWGVGIELEMALRAMIPTLFLHPADAAPSERATAHLKTMGATIFEMRGDLRGEEARTEIEKLVHGWLKSSFSLILGSQRRRVSMEDRYSSLLAAIRVKKTQMTELQERRALAASGLPVDRARTLVEEPWGLLSASFVEMLLLANAYGLRANVDKIVEEPISERPPHLTPLEEVALHAFVKEKGLSADEAIQLAIAGQREIVQPGRRRKVLTDEPNWEELWNRPQDGA